MKKLFVILLVIVLTSCGAALEPPKSNTDYKNIKGKSIKIGNLEIAQYDFPDEMNFEQAKKACNELGEGWSLPSRNSLNVLYKNARKIGGFWSIQDAWYLSSTNVDGISIQNFFNGKHDEGGSNYKYLVRAVCCNMNEPPKDNTDYKKIIGNTVKIGNLEIAQFDFPIYMNWLDARSACAALGDGWTLPTKDELTILYQNKDKVGDFSDNEYWSNSFDEEVIDRNAGTISGYPIYKDFYSGEKFRSQFGNEKRYVRAIKLINSSEKVPITNPKSNTDYKKINNVLSQEISSRLISKHINKIKLKDIEKLKLFIEKDLNTGGKIFYHLDKDVEEDTHVLYFYTQRSTDVFKFFIRNYDFSFDKKFYFTISEWTYEKDGGCKNMIYRVTVKIVENNLFYSVEKTGEAICAG